MGNYLFNQYKLYAIFELYLFPCPLPEKKILSFYKYENKNIED